MFRSVLGLILSIYVDLPVSVGFEVYAGQWTCLSLAFQMKRQPVHSFFASPETEYKSVRLGCSSSMLKAFYFFKITKIIVQVVLEHVINIMVSNLYLENLLGTIQPTWLRKVHTLGYNVTG